MEPTPHEPDVKTRSNLAYIWTFAIIAFISYILLMWGERMEILTLIIGFVTGTAATILAVYFGAPIGVKKPDVTVTQPGNNPETVIQPASKNTNQ
jgi:hypothetical protein